MASSETTEGPLSHLVSPRVPCPRCGGKGMAWQWRTYGHQEMHGDYYERCDVCKGEGTVREQI